MIWYDARNLIRNIFYDVMQVDLMSRNSEKRRVIPILTVTTLVYVPQETSHPVSGVNELLSSHD
jgi:hypothetical protein